MIRPMMTWEGSKHRWRKMYKGKMYTISCEALGCPASKLESYQQANQWWKAKKTEIDGLRPPSPFPQQVKVLELQRAWLQSKGYATEFVADIIKKIEAGEIDDPAVINHFIAPNEVWAQVWADRLTRDKPQPVPQDRTIGFQIKEYLDLLLTKHKAGEIGVDEYELTRGCLEVFKTWIGSDTLIDKLDADKWEDWYKEVLNSKISSAYKHRRFRCVKNLVAWLVDKGRITGPPNLHGRAYRFGASHKEVKPLSVNEVLAIIKKAKGVLRLHLMLMTNMGMGQKDISDLSPEEIV